MSFVERQSHYLGQADSMLWHLSTEVIIHFQEQVCNNMPILKCRFLARHFISIAKVKIGPCCYEGRKKQSDSNL